MRLSSFTGDLFEGNACHPSQGVLVEGMGGHPSQGFILKGMH